MVRAHAARVGITELTVGKGPGFGGPEHLVRMSPIELPTSKQIRLDRLYKHSLYKQADGGFLQLGMKKAPGKNPPNLAKQIVIAIEDLIPSSETSEESENVPS